MLHDLETYAAAYSFATLFVIFGLVLIIPTLLVVGGVWLSSRYFRRYGKLAVWFVIGAALATYLLAWNNRRVAYFETVAAIEARVANAPKLGRIDGSNLPLLTADYPFPEVELDGEDCFPDLWIKYPNGGSGPWRGGARPLPPAYLEFDLRDQVASPFGDHRHSGRRGPYELWFVKNGLKTLVNVFFLSGDGHSLIPPGLWPWWSEPEHLSNKQLVPELRKFLQRTTGRCNSPS